MSQTPKTTQGLRENRFQFALLVLVNAFVGGMVGLERTILPEIAEHEFGLDNKTTILSFIIVFGISKALTNYFTGRLANRFGRKRLLILGWLIGLPIPIILIYANSWNLILLSNILLGINQGLTWSSTVVMKIDLVGQKERGLAMGINEFSGYFAVGLVAFLTAVLAEQYGLRPYPFYLGIGLAVAGLLLSLVVKDTYHHVQQETHKSAEKGAKSVFLHTTFQHPNLSATTLAGMVNNLNDGMIWGLLPIFLLGRNFEVGDIGLMAGLYPMVWGIGQLFTGRMADLYSHKKILFWGMLLQGIAIALLVLGTQKWEFLSISVVLGLGTALVYPTFLVVISDNTHPQQRAEGIGVFRLWRDLGYAIGALLSGIVAELMGMEAAILLVALLTIGSSVVIKLRMKDGSMEPNL